MTEVCQLYQVLLGDASQGSIEGCHLECHGAHVMDGWRIRRSQACGDNSIRDCRS